MTNHNSHIIQSFMTHSMRDADISALATGRQEELSRILQAIKRSHNEAPGNLQNIVVYGSRGYGKSFMMRRVQIEIQKLDASPPIAFLLFPEEQHGLQKNPHDFLEQIAIRIENYNSSTDLAFETSHFRWPSKDNFQQQWSEAAKRVERAIDNLFEGVEGLVVICVENFDILLATLFKDNRDEQRLRGWLERDSSRTVLLATATGAIDLNYNRPLFRAFESISLKPWDQIECIRYYNRFRAYSGKPLLTERQEAKVRAISDYIGGAPRLAQLLADVLDTEDALSVATTMSALAERLSEYYRHRVEDLSPLARGMLDALIRGGEPASQTELAERVGARRQSDIARVMSDLQRADVIRGERSPNSREKLYRVTDRVFVHYYRLRQGSKTAQSRPLEAILDFLEAFYTPEEKRFQTLAYLEQGRLHEAKTFNRIAQNGMQRAESSYTLDMPSIDEALSLDLGTIGAAERQHWNNLLETDPLKAYQDAGPETLQSDVASAMIRAQALVRIGLPDKSYELLLDAISQSNLPNEKIILLFELSRLKISVLRKSSEAASYLNNALSSITFSDLSESNKGLFLRLSGWVDYKFGHTDKAIEKFEEGLRIIEGGQDPSVEVLLLEMLTACQIRKNDYGKAADFASKTIAVSKTCQKDFARYSRIAYGFAMHKMGQLESALTAYDEAADFSFKLGAFADYAECMKFKILTLETLGRRDEIWETHDRLREAANITNDVSVLRELGEALSASRLIDERAFEYLRSAVEAGDGAACHQLGVAYLNGRGVGRDPTMAFKLFALGDEYENSRATVYLAECFFRGLGTDNDDKKGFELLTKASANGNAQAMRARGVCFRDGLGVDPDADEAFRNFERAVEAGDDNALLYLGDCYQKGIGTKPNEDLAFFYFERAASVGNSHARTLVQAREALKALKRSSSETASVHVAWAKDHVATLGKCEFVDVPLVDLDWHEVTPGSAEARAVLAAVHEAVSLNGDLETLSGATCEALRQAPLLFYPGYRLVDLQLSWADDSKREPMILSAICGEHGAVLLDGTSPPIHAINQDLLTLPSPEIAQNYLSFFCAYVRGEEGPFYLARDVDELGLQRQVEDLLPEDVLKAGFKLTIRSDGADKDDSFRFDAVVFYSNALFKAKFKVQPTGMVEMEDDEPIAADLPSARRRFNGPLRSRKYTFKEWVAHLEDRAKKGDPQAMLDLAEAIRDDGDGDGDHHEAIEWYTRASISGSDEVSIRSLKQTAFLFAKLGDLTAAQRAATRMFTMAQASGELKNVVSAHFLRVQLSAYGEDIEAVQSFEKACDIIVEDQITDVGKASNYIEELLVGASISGKTEEVLSALSQKKELILSEKTTPSFTKSSGQRLAEYSVPLGRSQASEIITNFVRSAHVFIQSLPEELQDETWLQDVFSGFAEHCHQSDFLRDISLILTAEKISEDQMLPEMLNAIAAVDEAKKPKTVLARMDPDLATMVRKIRGIEEI